jgi:hypothetical protein
MKDPNLLLGREDLGPQFWILIGRSDETICARPAQYCSKQRRGFGKYPEITFFGMLE